MSARVSPAIETRRAQARWRWSNLCYAAEDRARRMTWRNGQPTITPREGRQFADEILATLDLGAVAVLFYNGLPGGGRARIIDSGDGRWIKLSREGLTRTIIVHEIAHLMTRDRGHGVRYRTAYLGLAEVWLPRYARSLRRGFDHYGLTYTAEADAPMPEVGDRVRIVSNRGRTTDRRGQTARVVEVRFDEARLQFDDLLLWYRESYFTIVENEGARS